MSLPTVSHTLNNGWSAAFSCFFYCFLCFFIYFKYVISINCDTFDTVSCGTFCNMILFCYTTDIYGNTIQVIFYHIHDWEIPGCCHVDALMECSFIGSGITEETYGNFICSHVFGCICGTSCDWNLSAYDTVCTKNTFVHCHDMHGSTFTFGVSGCFSEDFCHHLVQICPSGNQMSVSTMCTSDKVTFL